LVPPLKRRATFTAPLRGRRKTVGRQHHQQPTSCYVEQRTNGALCPSRQSWVRDVLTYGRVTRGSRGECPSPSVRAPLKIQDRAARPFTQPGAVPHEGRRPVHRVTFRTATSSTSPLRNHHRLTRDLNTTAPRCASAIRRDRVAYFTISGPRARSDRYPAHTARGRPGAASTRSHAYRRSSASRRELLRRRIDFAVALRRRRGRRRLR